MKKLILSTAMLFALSFTAGVMAQDAKPAKQTDKAKTECCKENKDKKEKKEGCCKEGKDAQKGCCGDKKSVDKSKADKK